jgi:hypothetical protein
MNDLNSRRLKIRRTRVIDIDKLVRIDIDQRKHAALHLHHDAVAAFKPVAHIV